MVCHLCTDFLLYDAFIEYLKFLNLIKYVIAGLQNMRYDIYCFSISFLDAYQILKVPVLYVCVRPKDGRIECSKQLLL